MGSRLFTSDTPQKIVVRLQELSDLLLADLKEHTEE